MTLMRRHSPLEEDCEYQVAKDAKHEDDLGHKLAPDVQLGAEVHRVEERTEEAKEHLQDLHGGQRRHLYERRCVRGGV